MAGTRNTQKVHVAHTLISGLTQCGRDLNGATRNADLDTARNFIPLRVLCAKCLNVSPSLQRHFATAGTAVAK